jgi:hypothetical protein
MHSSSIIQSPTALKNHIPVRRLVGTPNPKYYLCTRMIIDDGGLPKQLRDWALTYIFFVLIYMNF